MTRAKPSDVGRLGGGSDGGIPSPAVATNPPADLVLTPLRKGRGRTVREWLTTFHLVFVALDPGAQPSRRLRDTGGRILTNFEQADCRVAFLVTGDKAEAERFLGRWAAEILVLVDPERTAVKAFGLERLPALVHLGADGVVRGAAEGWDPKSWEAITDNLARMMRWTGPNLPAPRDPAPFIGAPV